MRSVPFLPAVVLLAGVQDLIRRYNGVLSTRVGYTSGSNSHATYRNHPGHAEAVEIIFDPERIGYREILHSSSRFTTRPRAIARATTSGAAIDRRSSIPATSRSESPKTRSPRGGIRSVARKSRHGSGSGKRLLGGRARTSGLPRAKSGRLHLPFRQAEVEAADSHREGCEHGLICTLRKIERHRFRRRVLLVHRMQPMSETWAAADGTIITIRPVCPEDLAIEREFVRGLSASTGYRRLMSARRLSLEELRHFTKIDQERELALIATTPVQGKERQIGVARYVKESSPGDAEFAIVLSDDWQGRGLGIKLLSSLLAAAKNNGLRRLVGTTMSENAGMLALGRKLGFKLARDPDSATITNLTIDLAGWSPKGASSIDDCR